MSVLEKAIGWLAPAECIGCGAEGSALCELCQAAEILPYGERCGFCGAVSPTCRTCAHCRASAPLHVWVCTDYAGRSKDLLQKYKFGHLRAAAFPMTAIMVENFQYFCHEKALDYLVIAVPTASSRRRQRGFGHAELLAVQIAGRLGLESHDVLGRLGQSRQVGARRSQRLEQLSGSYYLKRPDKISGCNILIIDDVITTGATLKAVTKVLRQAGANKIDALVFAKRL